jgi:hypothetical protein
MDMLEKNPLKRPSATDLLKKYFQNRQLEIPSQTEKGNEGSNVSITKHEGVNKISGGRQLL